MPHSQKNIVVVRDQSMFQYMIARGIQDFTLTCPEWNLGRLNPMRMDPKWKHYFSAWKPDGVLVLDSYAANQDFFSLPGVPAVLVDRLLERPEGISRVEADEREIGRKAAKYFLDHRFEHFAIVVTNVPKNFSIERETGFTEVLAVKGIEPFRYDGAHHGQTPWMSNAEFDAWLRSLPKPVGIYCVQDLFAIRVLEHCKTLGLRVPSEISILGTNNDRLTCESMRPFLSSVPVPLHQLGFNAAALLSELMESRDAGVPAEPRCVVINPGHIAERQSTSLRMITDPAIAEAANYIQDHALEKNVISEAARAAGINRRTLERGFQSHLDTSPGAFIQKIKLDHMKRLLTETDAQMWEIAAACSVTQEHLSRSIKRDSGLTPGAYRKRFRQNPNAIL